MEPEISVQSLLDKIKKEGIEEAEKEAGDILEKAQSKAESIVKRAEEQAQKVLDEAHAEIQKNQEAFERTMSQAGRNVILGLKDRIIHMCSKILEYEINEALTPEVLNEMILRLVENFRMDDEQELVVLLSDSDLKKLEALLVGALQGNFKKGIILQCSDKVQAGFRIGEREGSMHYDFTNKSFSEVFGQQLNPRISRFLDDTPSTSGDA